MALADHWDDLPWAPAEPVTPGAPVPVATLYGDPSQYTARQRLIGALRDEGISVAQFNRWSRATLCVPLDRYNEHWCDRYRLWLRTAEGGAAVRRWVREEG